MPAGRGANPAVAAAEGAAGAVPTELARDGLRLPAALIIMDGYGLDEPSDFNAVRLANTPCLSRISRECPHTSLLASGEAVGLPEGQMGNSEVGHLNIGAGRIVFQELTRVNRACADGSLAANEVLARAMEAAKAPGGALHFMGLLSDGGVHSNNAHLYALLELAAAREVPQVFVHCFMDGRDVPPKSGKGYMEELEAKLAELSTPACEMRIGSVMGRYYAMDRDNRWERVERAWRALVCAQPAAGEVAVAEGAGAGAAAMQASYDAGVTDEFVEPVALDPRGMRDGDAVVFFNFRPDRAREITRALTFPDFDGFARSAAPALHYVCLTEYDATFTVPVAFPKEFPDNVLADVLADAGLTQFHIAETEKYAHVTFFLNGGREEMKAGETRRLIPSPKVATYDLQPEMSAPEVAQDLAGAIDAGEADVYIVNFANCDMVGHTGVLDAAVAAVEAVDAGIAAVLAALERKGGAALITADHGNADRMRAEDGGPHTAHTTAPVPFALVDFSASGYALEDRQGALCDIAPTLLELIGLPAPKEMTGSSLLLAR